MAPLDPETYEPKPKTSYLFFPKLDICWWYWAQLTAINFPTYEGEE
jgi:hypothetical protein